MATIKDELRGGYTCQFVEKLPKDLQTECSICLHTVKEPYLVDCCGYRFCRTCIEPLQSAAKPRCPLCNGNFSSVVPDKLLQRTLNQKQVYCTRKTKGCEWTGELSRIEEHELNCPRKPIICDFCKKFQAPKNELKQHQKSCPSRLIRCPNGCGGSVKPSNLKGHMTRCPLTVISCEYAYAGCLLMMYRKDMKNHLEVAKQEHLLLLSGKVKEMEAEIQKLKSENASKDLKIRLLTNHEHNEDKETVPATRALVTNFPPQTDIDLVKSVFGQFG